MSGRRTLFLVSCVKENQPKPARARDLYCSDWFLKAREYVERRTGRWLILSAKHGVVEPRKVIRPYDATMYDKTAAERRDWVQLVSTKLRARIRRGDKVVLLAGVLYREPLLPLLRRSGCVVKIPMRGLGFGQQKAWLKRQCKRLSR